METERQARVFEDGGESRIVYCIDDALANVIYLKFLSFSLYTSTSKRYQVAIYWVNR